MNKIDVGYEEIKDEYNHFGREIFFNSLIDYIAVKCFFKCYN